MFLEYINAFKIIFKSFLHYKMSTFLYLCGPDMLGDFVKIKVELREFRFHHISASMPPAGHQNNGLVLDIVHAKTDVP